MYVVVTFEDYSKALAALNALFNYWSFILFKMWKQYLKVPIRLLALLESMSVIVHLFLTCYFSKK